MATTKTKATKKGYNGIRFAVTSQWAGAVRARGKAGRGRVRCGSKSIPSVWPGMRGLEPVFSGMKLLMVSVLNRAIVDASIGEREVREDAIAWLRGESDDCEHPGYTVHDVCKVLGISPRLLYIDTDLINN